MGVAEFFEMRSPSASVDEKGVRKYSRQFKMVMENIDDMPPSQWTTTGNELVIQRFDPYPFDFGATCRTLDMKPDADSPLVYTLTFEYSSAPFDKHDSSGNPKKSDQSQPPQSRPWKIKFGSTHYSRVLGPLDLANTPVVNSSKQPFNPPLERPSSNSTIMVTAYQQYGGSFDPVFNQMVFIDSLNNAPLTLPGITTSQYQTGTLKCTEYNASVETENNAPYYQIDCTLEYKYDGWQPLVLDAGTLQFISNSKPLQPIRDGANAIVQQPVPLNGAGQPLKAGNPFVYINQQTFNGSPPFSFQMFRWANFLNLFS